MRQMYTELIIKSSGSRSYIEYYFNGERFREYNGNRLGLPIYPNKAKTNKDRTKLLNKLKLELHKALDKGWNPLTVVLKPEMVAPVLTAPEILAQALAKKMGESLSRTYKRDIVYIHTEFVAFLSTAEKSGTLEAIDHLRIEEFLNRYNSSPKYYMNKRTVLAVLFAAAGRILKTKLVAVKETERRRVTSVGNVAYDLEQIQPLLEYLEKNRPTLYICAVLTYSTWLRPHVEIRSLCKRHFNKDFSTITLQGHENKGKRMRTVYVPYYAQKAIAHILEPMDRDEFIFKGKSGAAVNPDYFKTAWTRIRKDLMEKGLIRDGQTIYSFRHTAAVQMYSKAKDIRLLQHLMGHQSITVTENYLRSLGQVDIETMKEYAPTL